MHSYLQRIISLAIYSTKFRNRFICLRKRKTKALRNGRNYEKKGEITKHTRFLSTSNVDFQVDDGRDDDAAPGDDEDADDFVDTDSDSALAAAFASDEHDDIEEDGNGDGESNDNGDADDDCN